MKRTAQYWKARNALGELTLGEFWKHCRPKGRITVSGNNDATEQLEVIRSDRWRNRGEKEFSLLYLNIRITVSGHPLSYPLCMQLDQKIAVAGNSIQASLAKSIFPTVNGELSGTIRISFEHKPKCSV